MVRLHPLDVWLVKKGLSIPKFARMSGIHERTLYYNVNGEKAWPAADTALEIEKATGGDVTVADQLYWYEQRNKESKDAQGAKKTGRGRKAAGPK